MKKNLVTILLVLLLGITGCNKSENDQSFDLKLDPDTVIMQIDGQPLKYKEYNLYFNRIFLQSPYGKAQIDLKKHRNQKIKLLFRSSAVNDMMVKHFLLEEAKKKNLTATNEEVDKIYNEIEKRFGGKTRLQTHLEVANLTEESFKDSLKIDRIIKKVIDQLTKGVSVSEKEAKDYYELHKFDKYDLPETVKASHIFFKADERILRSEIEKKDKNIDDKALKAKIKEEIEKKRALAQDVMNQVNANPAKFEELAEKYSEHRISALHGGNLGFFPKGKLQPKLDEVLFDPNKVQVGKTYNKIIKSDIGFHIVKLTDHKKAGVIPFEALVEMGLKKQLLDQKKVEIVTKFVKDKKSKSKIEYKYDEFKQEVIRKELFKDSFNPANQSVKDISDKIDNKQAAKPEGKK